jgi:hypothetical protein
MPSGRVRPAVLTILIASLLLLANAVPASGAVRTPGHRLARLRPSSTPRTSQSPKIDNQWNPLARGMQFVLAGERTKEKDSSPIVCCRPLLT